MKSNLAAGWMNSDVPDLGALAPSHGFDAAQVTEWLAPRLAKYRAFRDVDRVPRSKQVDALTRLKKALEAAFDALDCDELVDSVEAELDAAAHRMKCELWRDVAARLRNDLTAASLCAGDAREVLRESAPQPGRPSAVRRDVLLGDLVAFVQADSALAFGAACGAAGAILTRCGVPCPDDPREVEKLLRAKPG